MVVISKMASHDSLWHKTADKYPLNVYPLANFHFHFRMSLDI